MVQMRARVKKKETIEEMERELEQDKSWKKEEFHGADDEPEDESLEMEEEEGIHTLSAKLSQLEAIDFDPRWGASSFLQSLKNTKNVTVDDGFFEEDHVVLDPKATWKEVSYTYPDSAFLANQLFDAEQDVKDDTKSQAKLPRLASLGRLASVLAGLNYTMQRSMASDSWLNLDSFDTFADFGDTHTKLKEMESAQKDEPSTKASKTKKEKTKKEKKEKEKKESKEELTEEIVAPVMEKRDKKDKTEKKTKFGGAKMELTHDGQEKSAIPYHIKKNRGLVKKRKKETRNARIHYKNMYQDKLKRRKGQVKDFDVSLRNREYGGEYAGINVRSVKAANLANF